ncbi:glycosyl hydrolase [Oligoflexus tunisiensis]|uniref:glycosyl hydrolase n=1 Tax=Oligoflexus tunisiensis TaxID=708132 RepID=UPI00114D3296|nr:glycosyl hydrolase [Oligoflexus tunisiensis]
MPMKNGLGWVFYACLWVWSGGLQAQLGSFAPAHVSGSQDSLETFQARRPVNKTSQIQGPVPSNTWWSNLLVRDEVKTMSPFPLFYSSAIHEYPAEGEAFGIAVAFRGAGKPTERTQGVTELPAGKVRTIGSDVQSQFMIWNSSMQRASTKSRLHAYGDWHIVTETSDAGGHRMYTTMTAGSPYSYFEFQNGQPRIRLNSHGGRIDITNGQGQPILRDGEQFVGDRILVQVLHPVSQESSLWGFFSTAGTQWRRQGEYLEVIIGGNGNELSTALLPRREDFQLFYQHAYAKIVGTRASYTHVEKEALIRTEFRFETKLTRPEFSSEVLTTLFPHQYKNMPAGGQNSLGSYATLRGSMRLWKGLSFRTELQNQGILLTLNQPSASVGYSAELHQQWIVWEDYVKSAFGVDTYGTGKALQRAAQSLAVAEAIGMDWLHDEIVQGLYNEFADWFTYSPGSEPTFWADNQPYKYFSNYLPTHGDWGHIVGWRASYGTPALNDHHLHYGYWIHAAALLAKYHPQFIKDYGWAVESLIRNIAAPDRQDRQFPYLRAFDPYSGRSYASGFYWFGYYDGNDLESSSEALNAWQAIYQWGQVTGQKQYRDLGLYLYWTERSAVDQYWLDVDGDVHHPAYDFPLVGILREGAYEFKTHWGSQNIEEYFGIQLLPLTPATLHMGLNRSYTRKIWDFMSQTNRQAKGTDFDTWHGTMLNFQALVDPQAAVQRYQFGEMAGLPGQEYSPLHDHETWSIIYHFIHNLNQLGRPMAGFRADAPAYGVFEKHGRYTFVAFNPSRDHALSVNFHDRNGWVHTIKDIPPGETVYSVKN